jgi:replicative DNA helicase
MKHQPHSVPSEQAIIGMLMNDNTLFDLIRDRLKPEDFYVPLYRDMFVQGLQLVRENLEFSPPVVIKRLVGKSDITEAELYGQLTSIFEAVGFARDIISVAYVVSECALQRRLIDAAGKLTIAAEANNVQEAEAWQKEIASLTRSVSHFVPETVSEQVASAVNAAHNKNKMMKTGLASWDRAFGGMFREKLYMISGHGGAGKSALGVTLAWNMAKDGRKVRWVSWEEDREAVWGRILARECRIDSKSIREGSLTDSQSDLLTGKGNEIMHHDLLCYYKLKDKGHIIDACGKCDLIVIDGLSRFPVSGGLSVMERVQEAMQAMGDISLKTGAAILILAHVNGDSVKNGAGISGVYGGQAATFDPEGIVDIRRSDDTVGENGRRAITLTVVKNRYGPEGIKIPLFFEGPYHNFYEQEWKMK